MSVAIYLKRKVEGIFNKQVGNGCWPLRRSRIFKTRKEAVVVEKCDD